MVLIVEDGCTFCEEFKDVPGLVLAKFLRNRDQQTLLLDGVEIPAPIAIPGLPTLLDGKSVYVGKEAVLMRLERKNND